MPEEQVTTTPEKEKTLVEWSAPSRPFKRRGRDFYVTIVSIASVFGLILFLVEGIMPVLLLISLIFLFYVLSTVEPEKINYSVTTTGVHIAKDVVPWDFLGRFWFTNRFGTEILVIETGNISGRLEIVIDPAKKDDIQKHLTERLIHEEATPSFLDKAVNWAGNKLPNS